MPKPRTMSTRCLRAASACLVWAAKKRRKKNPEAKPKRVATVSAYAPGSGLIEEEVIEEEEFDAPRHPHRAKAEDHDLEDFEEETLPRQMRTGDLGEMLQEAHLDHRIQLNFDGKTAKKRTEDEDEASAEGQPATGEASQRATAAATRRTPRPWQPEQPAQAGRRAAGRRAAPRRPPTCPLSATCSSPGQEILVQIAKEPIAKKARASPRTSPCRGAFWSSCPR